VPERQRDERQVAGRRALLAALAAHVSDDADERDALVRMQVFVAREPECFRRELEIGHVTGSAWVLDRGHRSVLLTHHRKLGAWLQLGGHADGEPDLRRVALREAREESGIDAIRLVDDAIFDVDVHSIPARPGEPAHLHYDVRFLFEAETDAPPAASDESHAVAWIALDRVCELSSDRSVLRMVSKTLRRRTDASQ
jgi:8-oxo-dGTP pyrophosphatase MutT (NUDIX family)